MGAPAIAGAMAGPPGWAALAVFAGAFVAFKIVRSWTEPRVERIRRLSDSSRKRIVMERKTAAARKKQESDEDDTADEEGLRRTVTVMHWNCGGLIRQTVRTLRDSILTIIRAAPPDIILLNELKAREEDLQAVVRGLGSSYAYLSIPSTAPRGRSMRGLAIIYRRSPAFSVQYADEAVEGWDRDAPAIEALAVDVTLHLTRRRYRLICSYVRGADQHFETTARIYERLSNGRTIVAGDLNMDKRRFREKWAASGFRDALHTDWSTNQSRHGQSAIDYVMYRGGRSVHCHKPMRPDSGSAHYPIYFELGSIDSHTDYCEDPDCEYGCGKR